MNDEAQRISNPEWRKWGPYLAERQWGTVREDYSPNGDAWNYTSYESSRSIAYRWGEDGIGGICDDNQILCFSWAFWNKKDAHIKERLFGLTNHEGNHGEDVKELYYYLDAAPSHAYLKMLYKYPHNEFPYEILKEQNRIRTRYEPEFELSDTQIFDDNNYFDIVIEYAKIAPEDILIKATIYNRGSAPASIHVLPQLWFRNTWSWGYGKPKPKMGLNSDGSILAKHAILGNYRLYVHEPAKKLFCDNETNIDKLYGIQQQDKYYKDGINEYLVHANKKAVNHHNSGTRVAINHELTIAGHGESSIWLRLSNYTIEKPFLGFEKFFKKFIQQTDAFYEKIQHHIKDKEEKQIQRQAFAGMIWSKQFYYYVVEKWLRGDPDQPPPPPERYNGRNRHWQHLSNKDIISMPDKWEYPWYATWDLAFHCLPFALIDPAFAKGQLKLLTKECYLHSNGEMPAYEWDFGASNPPVHAWACWQVYEIDKRNNNNNGDRVFLETVFHKLMINFTWWVNRKDAEGNNIFEGGFMGLDNIGIFDRNSKLAGHLEQADGTSWMAMYSLNMMRISLELAKQNPVYQEMATKFFEHFLHIADAMASMGIAGKGLWDETDDFYYDVLRLPDEVDIKLKVRSLVGLIPLFAVEVLDEALFKSQPVFAERLRWFLLNRPNLANLVSRWGEKGVNEQHLLSLLRGYRMTKILNRMLDEKEFLSPYGVRSLSKHYLKYPYQLCIHQNYFSIGYEPGESQSDLFGGNSNWRGPIWMPVNFLIIESLHRFHDYYGDEFKVEYPTGSGHLCTLKEINFGLIERLLRIFKQNKKGIRPLNGDNKKMQHDTYFDNPILFYEFFDGDTGKGLGAAHQTGWTGLIASIIDMKNAVNSST
jgi:Glycosyl hydrolase family 63 C-terminal domain